jgi:hypothetical protein
MRNPTDLNQETVEGWNDLPFEKNRFSRLRPSLREDAVCRIALAPEQH